jgi:hypothetical protein
MALFEQFIHFTTFGNADDGPRLVFMIAMCKRPSDRSTQPPDIFDAGSRTSLNRGWLSTSGGFALPLKGCASGMGGSFFFHATAAGWVAYGVSAAPTVEAIGHAGNRSGAGARNARVLRGPRLPQKGDTPWGLPGDPDRVNLGSGWHRCTTCSTHQCPLRLARSTAAKAMAAQMSGCCVVHREHCLQVSKEVRGARRGGVESPACAPSLWQAAPVVAKPRGAGETVDQAWPRHVDHLGPLLCAIPSHGASSPDHREDPSLAAGPQARSTRAKAMKNSSGGACDRHARPGGRREPASLAPVLTRSTANHEIRTRGKPINMAMIFIAQ